MASASPTEENKRIVRRIPEEVVNEDNLDAVEDIFAVDAVDHTPMGEFRGHDEIKEQFRMILRAFPDFSVTVEDMISEGDTVAVRVRQRGTHEGEFAGIEPTGETFEMQTMAFLRLEDGEVVERWIQPDQFGMRQQLGVADPPGE